MELHRIDGPQAQAWLCKDDTKKIRLLKRIEDLNPRKTLKMKATTGLQLDLIYLKNISGRFIGNLFYECTIIIQDGFC